MAAIYESPGGVVEVRLTGDTAWLNQSQLARLFGRERSVIARHIKNVFLDNELDEKSVCAKFAQTAPDSKTYQVDHYNLDAIISACADSRHHREACEAGGRLASSRMNFSLPQTQSND